MMNGPCGLLIRNAGQVATLSGAALARRFFGVQCPITFGEKDLWVPLSGLSGSANSDGMRCPLNLQRPGVMTCRFWQQAHLITTENNSLGHRLRTRNPRAMRIV